VPNYQGFNTRAIHVGQPPDPLTGATVPPLYLTSTYTQQALGEHLGYEYGRNDNPTRQALEEALASLEGGKAAVAFASGMAAITAVLLLLESGDHVLVTRDCQGGTQRLFRAVLARFGLTVSYVDTDDLDAVDAALRPNTKAIFIENFSNPFLRVTDTALVAEWAHSHQLLTLVDNTFLTPYLQQPLQLGADVVIHSASKMIAGHADVTAGVAVVANPDLGHRLYTILNACGMALAPDDAYLAQRGLKTLPLRMGQAQESALALAQALVTHPMVERVYYPGLSQHPGHDIAQRTMQGFGAMLTMRLADDQAVHRLVNRLQFVRIGAGFGGAETTISLPELHCHAALTETERAQRSITSDLVRISVGLEATTDILDEFFRSLD